MNNKGNTIITVITIIAVLLILLGCMSSCSEQSITKNFGGTMDLELNPNDKLLEVTWKDDSLWILTKEMTDNDVAEDYKFYESSSLGIFEGCVNIKETKLSKEEYEKYLENIQLKKDYNNPSNFETDGIETSVIYIKYNDDTDTYEKIKDYTYDENGYLIDK